MKYNKNSVQVERSFRQSYPQLPEKDEIGNGRKTTRKERLTACDRILLNYKRYGGFPEAVALPCFSLEIDPHRSETRQRSLIFHRGNRFYRGLPRVARPDSSARR